MDPDEYQCSLCKNVYRKGRSDEEALAETREAFGDVSNVALDVVCDDCHKKLQVPDYCCAECGIVNHKLWRVAASSHVELLCIRCIEAKTDERFGVEYNCPSDQIAGRVPAVPAAGGEWFGYTSVPEEGVKWWKGLPL